MVKIAIPNFCINFLNKTVKSLPILCDFAVASLADAWIKIAGTIKQIHGLMSHPSRMRGLKLEELSQMVDNRRVASLADAWIKIRLGTQQINHLKSHLIQMRGLKYEKLYKELINKLAASYMGVWIKCESSRI